jgi:4-hydroxy-4-methyl-2-oxoglutarate aldolase
MTQALSRKEIRERFSVVDTSNVADVLDVLGYPDQGLSSDLQLMIPSAGVLAGFAYTIRGQMTPFPLGGDPDKMKACAGLSADDISVWSGNGEGICYFGELIAIGMRDKGCVGALVDGGVRDTKWIDELGFQVCGKYKTPIQSIGRWKVNGCQVPVSMKGATRDHVTVNPGDFILADADGAIVIPQAILLQVLEESERLTEKEKLIRADLKKGLSLAAALEKYGHV